MVLIYLKGLKYEENTIVIRLLLINVCRRCKSTKFLWVVIQSQKNKIKKKNKAIKTKSNHFILMMFKFMTLNQISYTMPLLRASE